MYSLSKQTMKPCIAISSSVCVASREAVAVLRKRENEIPITCRRPALLPLNGLFPQIGREKIWARPGSLEWPARLHTTRMWTCPRTPRKIAVSG